MLALHFLLLFIMLYALMYHIFFVPKRKYLWLTLTIVTLLILIVELYIGAYELHSFFQPLIYELTYTILANFVMILFFKGWKKIPLLIILNVLVIYIISLGMGLAFSFFEIYFQNVLISPIYSFLGAFSGFILFWFLYPLIRFMKINRVTLKMTGILLVLISLISLGYYTVAQFRIAFSNHNSLWSNIVSILTLFGGIVPIFVIISIILKDNQLKEKSSQAIKLNYQYKMQQEHYRLLNEREESTKKFRHDISKYIEICQNLLHKNELEKLDSYFNEMISKYDDLTSNFQFTSGSEFVDAGLNNLRKKSKYKNVLINKNWVIPNNLVISPLDITSLFMNLFENSYEAASKCIENQYINVYINHQYNFLSIVIENSYSGKLTLENEHLKTTKISNSNHHGFGIKIIKDIVEKYNGTYKFINTDNVFRVEISFGTEIYIKE